MRLCVHGNAKRALYCDGDNSTLYNYDIYINPSKQVLQFKFTGWYISCYWSMKKETGIIEKLDYSSLQWCVICRDYVLMECAVLLNIGQSQKWNVAKSLHFFWRCNVFWIVPSVQCMSCMNVNGVMFFSLKDEMCLNDVHVVIDEVQRHEWCYPLLFGRWNLPWIMFVWGRAAVYWVVVCKM